MDIIEQARELGRQIQKDDRYLKVQIAQQNSDNDKELQALIGEFNLKRMNINTEAQKEDRSEEKLQKLNQELRACYASIMKNENMAAYNMARQELDALLNRVNAIIMQRIRILPTTRSPAAATAPPAAAATDSPYH